MQRITKEQLFEQRLQTLKIKYFEAVKNKDSVLATIYKEHYEYLLTQK